MNRYTCCHSYRLDKHSSDNSFRFLKTTDGKMMRSSANTSKSPVGQWANRTWHTPSHTCKQWASPTTIPTDRVLSWRCFTQAAATVSPVCPPAGEGLVPEPQDEAQAAEVGGRVTWGAAEEERQPAREPLEGRHAAADGRRRRRHQRRLDTHVHADPCRGASS